MTARADREPLHSRDQRGLVLWGADGTVAALSERGQQRAPSLSPKLRDRVSSSRGWRWFVRRRSASNPTGGLSPSATSSPTRKLRAGAPPDRRRWAEGAERRALRPNSASVGSRDFTVRLQAKDGVFGAINSAVAATLEVVIGTSQITLTLSHVLLRHFGWVRLVYALRSKRPYRGQEFVSRIALAGLQRARRGRERDDDVSSRRRPISTTGPRHISRKSATSAPHTHSHSPRPSLPDRRAPPPSPRRTAHSSGSPEARSCRRHPGGFRRPRWACRLLRLVRYRNPLACAVSRPPPLAISSACRS